MLTVFAFFMRYLYFQLKKMKIKSIVLIGTTAALLALPSCKKDNETSSTKEYLSGTLTFSMPSYVQKGEEYTLTPSGLKNPGTGSAQDIGYYWTTSFSSEKDTTKLESDTKGDGSYKLTIPPKVGEFSVSCVAFATDYYTSSNSVTFCVVDPAIDSTISGAYSDKEATFIDTRDGSTYYTTTFNDKTWIKNNLYYSGGGVSYDNCSAVDPIFGRLYTWHDAMTACPEGWHLPSEAEFVALATALAPENAKFSEKADFSGVAGGMMVNAKFLDTRMWEYWPQVKITNKSGFSALPIGYATLTGDSPKFTGEYNYAMFWTSDSEDDEMAYCRYIYVKQNDVLVRKADKESFLASVRCVKD